MRNSIKLVILQFIFVTNVDICSFVLGAVTVFGRGKDYQEINDVHSS